MTTKTLVPKPFSLRWLVVLLWAAIVLRPEALEASCFPYPSVRVNAPTFSVGAFEVHDTLSGLPTNRIRSLWWAGAVLLAGTEGEGLLVFRNKSWQHFGPRSDPPFPAPTVTGFCLGEEAGTILAATVAGPVEIRGLDGKLSFTLLPLETTPSLNILCLARDANNTWVGTDQGAGQLTARQILPFVNPENITPTGFSTVGVFEGRTWVGGESGLFANTGRTLTPMSFPGYEGGWIQALEPAGKGLFLGGTKGLARLEQDEVRTLLDDRWVTCLAMTGGVTDVLSGKKLQAIELESDGEPGTDAGGSAMAAGSPNLDQARRELTERAARLNELAARLNAAIAATGAPPPLSGDRQFRTELASLQQDVSRLNAQMSISSPLVKGLWVGTHDRGVLLFATDGARRELTTENSRLPGNRITAIASRDTGETWIATFDGGLLHYTRYVVNPSSIPVPVWSGIAQALAVVGRNLYVGTKEHGLLIFDPRTLEAQGTVDQKQVPGFHKSVSAVAGDASGRLWVTGNEGVWMLADGNWRHFTRQDGLPEETTTGIEIDAMGRTYVSCGTSGEISRQLTVFNGIGFITYAVETLKAILAMEPAQARIHLRDLGLLETYLGSLDLANATQALRLYDKGGEVNQITALRGFRDYLILGTANGSIFAFNGERFRRIEREGVGKMSRVVGLGKRPNGDLVVADAGKLLRMDGQHFFPLPEPEIESRKYTGLAMDDRNGNLFWVSYQSLEEGGIALYQDPVWRILPQKEPVQGIALSEPFLFFRTPTGVFRLTR